MQGKRTSWNNSLFTAVEEPRHAIVDGFNRERHNMAARRDFTYSEWQSLVAFYREESATLSPDTEERFRKLGLIDRNRITDTGKRLVEHELLVERRNRLQD